MASTTFFGNRASCRVLHAWTPGTYSFTHGLTAFTGSGVAGDYVWTTIDGIQHACRVASPGVLAYAWEGVTRAGVAGFKSTPMLMQVLRGLEINILWETADLYGTDAINRVDQAKYQIRGEAKAKYCKWDPAVTVDWQAAVIHPDTTPDGTVQNTNTCYLNGVVYTIRGSNGDYLDVVCGLTYWEGVPYPFPENDFMIKDVTGKAKSVTAHKF